MPITPTPPNPFGPLPTEKRAWEPDSPDAGHHTVLRHTGAYEAAIPAAIAELDPLRLLGSATLTEADQAIQALIRFDSDTTSGRRGRAAELGPMRSILLRAESAASSQIENLTVGARQLALFELGERASANARLVAQNVQSMEAALRLGSEITLATLLATHRVLLEGHDPNAGCLRTEQVWIGGSSVAPRGADFIPPHHERVPDAIADLIRFIGRTDLPPLVQTAVAHAQFETIHPFTDGNGRTGRALVQAMLRSREVARLTTVPVSAGLLVDTARYFDALTAYREGRLEPIVNEFSHAFRFAAIEGQALVDDLEEIRSGTIQAITARSDSAVWPLIDLLSGQPVINTAWAATELEVSKVAAQSAIDRLVEAGVLTESTGRTAGDPSDTQMNQVCDALSVARDREKRSAHVRSKRGYVADAVPGGTATIQVSEATHDLLVRQARRRGLLLSELLSRIAKAGEREVAFAAERVRSPDTHRPVGFTASFAVNPRIGHAAAGLSGPSRGPGRSGPRPSCAVAAGPGPDSRRPGWWRP